MKELFRNPLHPYTRGLLASLPTVDGPRENRLTTIPGSVPSILDLPVGCKFGDALQRGGWRSAPPSSRATLIETLLGALGALPPGESMKILEVVENLRVSFPVTGGVFARKIAEVKAVDGVSFTLEKGETLGVVGESGCGKSTVGRAIVNILRAMVYGVEISGKIIYHPAATAGAAEKGTDSQAAMRPSGKALATPSIESPTQSPIESPTESVDLARLSRKEMRPYRPEIQMIFQDPYSSLNPRMMVGQIVEEPLTIHSKFSSKERKERVRWLLEKVGFSREQTNRYPHEFSGGQRKWHRHCARAGDASQDRGG